jgi:5-methylcytosine-specific restriction endonuclease McrA
MNKVENSKCLLLNADYSPLKIICWQKAIVWSLKYESKHNYAIEIIEYYKDKYIQGANNKTYPVPLVAKTLRYFNIYNRSLKFSRNNLFIRDNFTCQYCGTSLSYGQLTYDHIVPKSFFRHNKKDATNWTNVTTACLPCNRKKSNKTIDQAGMKLINSPKQPMYDTKYLPINKQLLTIDCEQIAEWLKNTNTFQISNNA